MARKKPVKTKIRKWVTCATPGCKRRARSGGDFCGEHEQKKRDSLRKKFDAADKKKKERKAAAKIESGKCQDQLILGTRLRAANASRLIKAHCENCGYTIRLSRKWIEVKRPICPVCMKNMTTAIDGEVDADPRQLPIKALKKGGV